MLAGFVAVAARSRFKPGRRGDFPGANGRVTFVRDGEIHTMNPDGSREAYLQRYGDYTPAFSPDGRRLPIPDTVAPAPDLRLMNADGSGNHSSPTARVLTEAAWSPDGKDSLQSSRHLLARLRQRRALAAHLSRPTGRSRVISGPRTAGVEQRKRHTRRRSG